VASCSICSEVLAETIRFALEEEEVEPIPERSGHRSRFVFFRRPGNGRAAGLAAAAVLVLAVGYFAWRSRPSTPAAGPLLAELAEAMGTERFVEPRLTGGFEHGRLVVLRSGEKPRGLDAYPPTVLAAVARIRERAEADPSPENLGALGITYLVSGDVPAAVKTLESATKQAPDDPRLQSNLAAAYLVRAHRLDEPADLPRALDAAEKAVAQGDPPVEAWFNRALALESLHLTDAARKAWEDYLERDGSSEWADEARQHLESLPQADRSSLEDDRARVREALQEGPAPVERLADEEPSILRDYFEAVLLPAWSEAQLTGQPAAVVLHDHARVIGDALLHATGDALARDTARALEGTPQAASRDPPRSQALGFRALREAIQLFDAEQPSCTSFREALRLLDEGGSPFVDRAREWLVHACLLLPQPQQAVAELGRLETVAAERGHTHVLARVHWLEALVLGRQGELGVSLDRYRLARGDLRRLRDAESDASVSTLIAENLRELGEYRQAWHERMGGLVRLDQIRAPRVLYRTLAEASVGCQAQALMRCALHFESASVDVARGWGNPVALADALVSRGGILHSIGSGDQAAADLAEARQVIPRIGEPSEREFVEALAEKTNGELLARRQPEAATASIEKAMGFFERTVPSYLPALRLSMARSLLGQGRDDEAEAELRAGIEEVEAERLSLRDVALQVSFFDEGVPLFDEMVKLQLDRRHDPGQALQFVERGRARQLADSLGSSASGTDGATLADELSRPLEPEAIQRELPPGVALVYYQTLPGRILAWTLTRDRSGFAENRLGAEELRRRMGTYQAALGLRASTAVLDEASAPLYDALVRPLAPWIRNEETLILVPDAALQSLPFASLRNRDTGRYLVEEHVLGLAPSGTVLVRATAAASDPRRREDMAPLIVGNPWLDPEVWPNMPNLPGAEAEAVEIAHLYGATEALTGRAATRSAFLARLPESGIVHYAGHAVSDEGAFAGRLLLAADPGADDTGALSLRELEGMRLPRTRAVVLGACRTASGVVSPLEGSLSLARPFLAAGVPSVVASLWDLDDAISRTFLAELHRDLRGGADPLSALRQTQLALLRGRDPLLSHPASWAGFVGVGGVSPPR